MAKLAKKERAIKSEDHPLTLIYGENEISKYWTSSLFNSVYLKHDISSKNKKWASDDDLGFQNFMNDLRNISIEYKNRDGELSNWSETETINNIIKHVLNALGWSDNCNGVQNPFLEETSFRYDGKTYRTDILLVDHPKEKQYVNQVNGDARLTEARQSVLMPVEVKYWNRLEEFRQGQKESDKKLKDEIDDFERTLSPNEQIIKYMTILKKDWGILTDGARWRLFNRDLSEEDAERFYEFNFYALFQSICTEETESDSKEIIEAAKYFYFFFSKQAFFPKSNEEPFVQEVLTYSRKYVNKVEEDLRTRFVKAMNVACNGFDKNNKSKNENLDLIRNVSESALFNLLFIRSLESRGILPMNSTDYKKISLSSIVDKIERFDPEKESELNVRELQRSFSKGNGNSFDFKDNGFDLHDRILRLASVINKGANKKDNFGFEIAGFKESIFSQVEWKFFSEVKLTNQDWVKIIFQLTYAESESKNRKFQQIPYAYFTPRQLGSIYESFLEFKIERADTELIYEKKQWKSADLVSKKINKSGYPVVKKGELFFTPDNEDRKATGTYYTPDFVVKYVLNKTLDPILDGLSSKEILRLKLCDPAMGSGHFLVEALRKVTTAYMQGLVKEDGHSTRKDPYTARNEVLSRCIFGVDINPRAVKLARMSLWLSTAQIGAPLESLDDQLKCGDSILEGGSDKEVGFKWQKEFELVFKDGGFDAIVGNPPYVRQEYLKSAKDFLKTNYKAFHGQADLFVYFIEKGISLLKPKGRLGYLVSNKWFKAQYGQNLRELLGKGYVREILDMGGSSIIENATTYLCTLILEKPLNTKSIPTDFEFMKCEVSNKGEFESSVTSDWQRVSYGTLSSEGWFLTGSVESKALKKVWEKCISFGDYVEGHAYSGIKTGLTEAFVVDESLASVMIKRDKDARVLVKPYAFGPDIKAYERPSPEKFVILIPKGWTNQHIKETKKWDVFAKRNPTISNHLEKFEAKAKKRSDQGDYWWELRACDYYDLIEKPKMLYLMLQTQPAFTIDRENTIGTNNTWFIPGEDKFLLAFLNSKIAWWLYSIYCTEIQGGFVLTYDYLSRIPVPKIGKEVARAKSKMYGKILDFVDLLLNSKTTESRKVEAKEAIERLFEEYFEVKFSEILERPEERRSPRKKTAA